MAVPGSACEVELCSPKALASLLTVSCTCADVEVLKFESPEYCAESVLDPTGKELVVRAPLPDASRVTVPIDDEPAKKVMVPDGRVLVAFELTLAVRVTVVPTLA